MCLNPIQIRNPNRGIHHNDGIWKLKDTTSAFLNIPCGHCAECTAVRQMSFVQRCQMEALENHVFFATLTYNNESIPEIGLSDGFSVRYVDTSDISNMFKRIRNDNLFGRPFRFVYVTELGSKRGRPHVHCLFFIPKYENDSYLDCLNLESTLFKVVLSEWRRNYGSRRNPDYRQLCTFVRYFVRGKMRSTYDLHYVNPILSSGCEVDVAFYVSKYMIKESDKLVNLQRALRLNLPDDEYQDVWKLVKPRWSASPLFGLNGTFVSHNNYSPSPVVLDRIRECVSISRNEFTAPKFINPVDGKSFPLSRYYLNRLDCVSLDDWLFFYDLNVNNGSRRVDNLSVDDRSRNEVLSAIDTANIKLGRLQFDYDDFDDLF